MILQQVLTESDLQNICVRPNSAVVVMAQSTMSVEQRREGGGGSGFEFHLTLDIKTTL